MASMDDFRFFKKMSSSFGHYYDKHIWDCSSEFQIFVVIWKEKDVKKLHISLYPGSSCDRFTG